MVERDEGSVSCSILVRRDQALLRLDHCNIGRAIERRRKWFARRGRPMARNQSSRPAGAMNQSRRIWPVPAFVTLWCTPRPISIMVSGSTSYSFAIDVGLPAAAIAEQQLVAALMGMAADVCARLGRSRMRRRASYRG